MKNNTFLNTFGFTLIELMIAVVILGILATLATGSFLSYQAKSKQAETKSNISSNEIAAAGTPTTAEAGVDYSDPGSAATVNTFIVGSVGNIDRDASTDQWLYDQDRVFANLQNDVSTP